ncbi:hypothetical protein B0A48_06906 [Cryoendolithus antarcticus]|uniref:Uncharacterized protein n=1 Tax=Cryoendolithus antarcticus TaxID=1507870 RepID=A0A1V8TA95_9PEZI|nr:hypothetical protein B0A48_06906 [Cryoendolithus antarcticus]
MLLEVSLQQNPEVWQEQGRTRLSSRCLMATHIYILCPTIKRDLAGDIATMKTQLIFFGHAAVVAALHFRYRGSIGEDERAEVVIINGCCNTQDGR